MSDEALKKLEAIEEDIKEIKKYIGARDKMTNQEYCYYRGITINALRKWFEKPGCPRLDNRHVSKSAVDKWASENNTRQPKKK